MQLCCSYCEGSHKKPVEPVEPVVSDTMSSQSGSSFAIATSYSDHVSTSSSMLTTDGLTQSGTQSGTESGAQPNIMDDVMATMSSSAQGSNQIEVPMSLNSRLTVAINSSVSINSNSGSGSMTTSMPSVEPFTSIAAVVSSQSQSSNLFTIGGGSSNILGTGKMTPPPPAASYAETGDNKGDNILVPIDFIDCDIMYFSLS